MIRCNGLDWRADFTLARALTQHFEASGKRTLVYLCVGDPGDLYDGIGPMVGDELRKYYPHVVGTTEEPVADACLAETWQSIAGEWPGAFVIGIEAGAGPAQFVGHIEVTDRGLRRTLAGGVAQWMGDVGVCALLRPEGGAEASQRPLDINAVRRIADAIIDGQIRFLQKVEKYEPLL